MQKTSPHLAPDSSESRGSALVGEVLLGKYRLQRELGRGGMGVVYAAEHLLLGQQVALKMMLPHVAQDPEAVARFLNEGRAAARLENEHVARVMDVGLLKDGTPFLVLELLEGLDLADMLHAGGPMPVARVVDYLLEAMEAIAEAHAAGIIHRDLKPSNLFVAERKGGASIKVLDFGISKALAKDSRREQVITATNAILGSPAYMSPEQLRSAREIDVRADIWSLGVIAYELLTGKLPYTGPNVVELFAVIQERDPRPLRELRPEVPARVDDAIRRCLRRSVTERWPSVLGFATALAPFGSPGAKASLARIEMLLAELVSVPPPASESAAPRTRISVPDTDPDNLPSTTMLAGTGSNPQFVMPVAARSTTGGLAKPPAPAQGAPWKRRAVVTLAIGIVAVVLLVLLTRGATPPPVDAVRTAAPAPSIVPVPVETTSAPAPALPAPAASVVPVTAPPRAAPRVVSPAKPAARAASAKKGVPSDWN